MRRDLFIELAQLRISRVVLTGHLSDHLFSLLCCQLQQVLLYLLSPLPVSLNRTHHHKLVIRVQLQQSLFLRPMRACNTFDFIVWLEVGVLQVI